GRGTGARPDPGAVRGGGCADRVGTACLPRRAGSEGQPSAALRGAVGQRRQPADRGEPDVATALLPLGVGEPAPGPAAGERDGRASGTAVCAGCGDPGAYGRGAIQPLGGPRGGDHAAAG